MSDIRIPQNPGIASLSELTSIERNFLQSLSGLSYTEGDILYYTGSALTNLEVGTNGYVLTLAAGVPTWAAAPAGAITSVNTQTGVVVLDADDISDTLTTNKFVTAADITNLGNLSGINSGDDAVNSLYSGLATSKQDTLVSGTNIKTVNSTSLLGTGNIDTTQTTITGNAGTATALQIARTIAGQSFDGTANITIASTDLSDTSSIVLLTSTQTLTNKGITKRVVTTTDDATAVIDVAITDVYELSAIANATTFSFTGTPTDGQQIIIRFKDAGVTKALTFTGFTVIGVTLPTTTTVSKWHYVGVQYNSAAAAWHVIAVGEEV